MTQNDDKRHRSHLPMPNTEHPKFIAYDAKDPDSKFPPHSPTASAQGRAQRFDRSFGRRRVWVRQRLRRAMLNPQRRETGGRWAQVKSIPHDRSLFAHPASPVDGPQSPFLRHGGHHRDRHRRAGILFRPTQFHGAPGKNA